MTSVQIPGAEGAKISGYLTLPVGVEQKNLPAVVLPHGNTFERDHWGYDALVQMLANRGYAVLQVNFRGSSGLRREMAVGRRARMDDYQLTMTSPPARVGWRARESLIRSASA